MFDLNLLDGKPEKAAHFTPPRTRVGIHRVAYACAVGDMLTQCFDTQCVHALIVPNLRKSGP